MNTQDLHAADGAEGPTRADDPAQLSWRNACDALVGSPAFYGRQRGHAALGPPTVFAVGVSAVLLALELLFACLLGGEAALQAATDGLLCLLLPVAFASWLATLLAGSAVLHWCLRLAGTRERFGLAYRTVVLANVPNMVGAAVAAMLRSADPNAGPETVVLVAVAGAWSAFVLHAAVKSIYGLSPRRAAAAAAPVVLMAAAISLGLAVRHSDPPSVESPDLAQQVVNELYHQPHGPGVGKGQ